MILPVKKFMVQLEACYQGTFPGPQPLLLACEPREFGLDKEADRNAEETSVKSGQLGIRKSSCWEAVQRKRSHPRVYNNNHAHPYLMSQRPNETRCLVPLWKNWMSTHTWEREKPLHMPLFPRSHSDE